ncbi:MAG: hypothetical protein WCR69_08255 [Sulfuricurvum sp.]|jgi:hypothetical protein
MLLESDKKLAPIVLFTYNRLSHTRQTLEALQQNKLASKSELFIFSDGGKDEESWQKVNKVREYLKTIKRFKNITLVFGEKNIGLADSIIFGVTDIVNRYGKIIVLEDDIVTSPYFLKFMNDALSFYENEKSIWDITGWNYPIKTEVSRDTFMWRVAGCWGWATWADRWKNFQRNPQELVDRFSAYDIYKFNLDGVYDFWSQVVLNNEGKIDTWAIFWYAASFEHNALSVAPVKSLVKNIGFDDQATNCFGEDPFDGMVEKTCPAVFEGKISEDYEVVESIKSYIISSKQEDRLYWFSKELNRIYIEAKKITGRVVLYGDGVFAKILRPILKDKIVGGINTEVLKNNPKILLAIEYDLIVITALGREAEIFLFLTNQIGIEKNKIFTFKKQ